MAAARERNENGNPYDDGGGFGKFRKRPFRRAQATPYDRPPTAVRQGGNNGNGWLSRLVDPAHRLITSSAHKLFSSVFRKPLPPPPPPPLPEPESDDEGVGNKQQEAVPKDLPGVQVADVSGCENLTNSSEGDEITQLELILKQKTFTRSEIDRLTALLQSKTLDPHVGNEEKKSELPSTPLLSQDEKDSLNTPVKFLNSIPTVLDEDVASPTELAKAYMGSRPLKVSPSMLGLHSQPLRETSMAPPNYPFSLKSPIMRVVPGSSGHTGFLENGFVTPRSRGRSAIYSMARTPYSRVHSTTTLQVAGTAIDSSRPSSSSHGVWKSNKSSGIKQGDLKRRNSVLDNDIGAVGPIRRIRQKSNLLPASGALVIHRTASSSDIADRPSLSEKDVVGEKSKENGDNGIHVSGFTPVPSKSTEMASKILHQLDVLVSSRDKSPSKLSPSMLRGPALRSLENVDSSKFLENFQGSNKLVVSPDTAPDSLRQKQDYIEVNGPTKLIASYKKTTSDVNSLDTSSSMENDVPGAKTVAITVVNSATQPPPQKKHAFQMSAHEDYLDLDDDDYLNGPVSATLAEGREKQDSTLKENKHSATETALMEKPPSLPEVIPSTSSVMNQKSMGASDGSLFTEKSNGFSFSGTPLPTATIEHAIIDSQSTGASDKAASAKGLNATPIFRFGDKVVPSEEPNGASPMPNCSTTMTNKIVASSSVGTESSSIKFIPSSNPKPESSSSFASVATGAIEWQTKELQSGKGEIKHRLNAGFFSDKPETATSAALTPSPNSSVFSFGSPFNGSSLSNGSFSSSSSFSSPSTALIPSNIIGQSSSTSTTNVIANGSAAVIATTLNASTSNNSSTSEPTPSFTTTPISKLGNSVVAATSSLSASATTGVELTEDKTKGTSFGNVISAPFTGTSATTSSAASSLFSGTSATTSTGNDNFSGTSSAITSSGSKIFTGTSTTTGTGSTLFSGMSSAITGTGSSLFSGTSAVTSTGSSIFNFNAGATTAAATNQLGYNPFGAGSSQAAVAGTTFAASTQSTPSLFVSSAPSPTFGLTGSTTFSSSSTTTNAAKLFSSGPPFALTSTSASEPNSVGSSNSTIATVFGSSWQTPISSAFGSTLNSSPSTGFAFTASSTPNAAINNASMAFGSSTGASSGSIFSFTSSVASTPAQPLLGTAYPGFPISSSPSGNNDQMNMEDSMAEDTMQTTTPTVPVYGQPAAPTGAGFIFGATPSSSSVGNQFASTTPPGGNIFQFGKQPTMVTPQNPSPFQGSGSFDAGGAFSLGTSGGEKSARKFVKVRKTQRKK